MAVNGAGWQTIPKETVTVLGVMVLALLGGPVAAAPSSSCLNELETDLIRAGISREVVHRALDGAQIAERVVKRSRNQLELKKPARDYFSVLVTPERIRDGCEMMRKYDRVLRAVEWKFGVNRYVVVAIWGIETDYGRKLGNFFLPHALATMACQQGQRADFWRKELLAALRLVDHGDVALGELYGSWAGAFGQTQFIPTTYQHFAVDFDGDGHRDLVHSVADALASTANYLRENGWRRGKSWLIEVKAPSDYGGPTGRHDKASLSVWTKRGLMRADGKLLTGDSQAGLLLPAGPAGPGFLVLDNFDSIYAYNHSEIYALAISYLADRIAFYPALRTPWPKG
ncbi:MAG: lytic murein transglycosylase [Hyphomicrobiales bacterium]